MGSVFASTFPVATYCPIPIAQEKRVADDSLTTSGYIFACVLIPWHSPAYVYSSCLVLYLDVFGTSTGQCKPLH